MPLFLSEHDLNAFHSARTTEPLISMFWAMVARVDHRADTPGLINHSGATGWQYPVSEYLPDAAIIYTLKPNEKIKTWLRDTTLAIIRRPATDWAGIPPHQPSSDASSKLGTAHLTWSVALVLDLAGSIFTPDEKLELVQAIQEKGLNVCQQALDQCHALNHVPCLLNAAIAVAAAILRKEDTLAKAAEVFSRHVHLFHPDGSGADSLQNANYAAYGLMLAYEALIRSNTKLQRSLPLGPYARKVRWDAASLLYKKPLSGWPGQAPARSANFNDSPAIYRPSADVLLHIATRGKDTFPTESGLARWLFDTLYVPFSAPCPGTEGSFDFINNFGFMSLLLLAQATPPISPRQADIPELAAFTGGDSFARDSWEAPQTILAVHGPADSPASAAHAHGDLNSFILVHQNERLLVDPGHSACRDLMYEQDISTRTHNTCTFTEGSTLIEQNTVSPQVDSPPHARGKRLLLAREGALTVIATDAAAAYGEPIRTFTRFWMLCGSHALFIVDHIKTDRPVKTTWNWLFNNRDNQLDLKLVPPDRLVARRGKVGMKLFNLGKHQLYGPIHAHVHDAVPTRPGHSGTGASGSGQLVRWNETEETRERTAIHAICVDTLGRAASWHLFQSGDEYALESPNAQENWVLSGSIEQGFTIQETVSENHYMVSPTGNKWQLSHRHPSAAPS